MPSIKGKIEKLSKFKANTKWGEKDKWAITVEGKQITGWGIAPDNFKEGQEIELEYEQNGEYLNYKKPEAKTQFTQQRQEYQEHKDILMARMSGFRGVSDIIAQEKEMDYEDKIIELQKQSERATNFILTGKW